MRAIRIGKRYFSPSDFSWLDGTNKDVEDEALNECQSLGRDMYCVYDMGLAPQAGFATSRDFGVKKTVYAIAPFVSSKYKSFPDLVGIFLVSAKGDGGEESIQYYGIIVLGGLIQEDRTGSYDEMKAWYSEKTGLHSSIRSILPDGWTGSGETERAPDLETLILALDDDEELFCPFVSVHEVRRRLVRFGVMATIAIVGMILLIHYKHSLSETSRPVTKTIVQVVKPHKEVVPVGVLLKECRSLFGSVRVSVSGWRLESISCDSRAKKVMLRWDRRFGTIADLRLVERRGSWVLSMNKATEIMSFPFSTQTVYSSDLPKKEAAAERLLAFFQSVDSKVSVNDGSFTNKLNPGIGTEKWEASFEVFPDAIFRADMGWKSGIYAREITYGLVKGLWTIKGDLLYAKE